MNKILYECYYVVGYDHFHSCYQMTVDRETNKMYYGMVSNSRFAIYQSDINNVRKIVDKKYGTVYRVQVDDVANEYEAKQKAREIIYDYMIDFVEKFKNYKED